MSAASTTDSVRRPAWLIWPVAMLFSSAPLVVASGALLGRQGIEKTATALASPVAFAWLMLTSWVLLAWLSTNVGGRWAATLLWIGFTLCSTAPLPNWCVTYLESQVQPYQPSKEAPLDVLLVLGGATRAGPTRSEVSSSGDRVVYAAQLYIQGHAQRLITSGTAAASLRRPDPQFDPAQQTVEIWEGLGIPSTSITTLPGRNTYEEIQNLKATLATIDGRRIGILSSAIHLPRVLKLAQRAGMPDIIPVAANHRYNTRGFEVYSLIPSADNLGKLAACQHEFMGTLIGR